MSWADKRSAVTLFCNRLEKSPVNICMLMHHFGTFPWSDEPSLLERHFTQTFLNIKEEVFFDCMKWVLRDTTTGTKQWIFRRNLFCSIFCYDTGPAGQAAPSWHRHRCVVCVSTSCWASVCRLIRLGIKPCDLAPLQPPHSLLTRLSFCPLSPASFLFMHILHLHKM